MADNAEKELIIVRRYEAEEDAPKGGVWKIAHADFMTAMMAFFLIMWLIGAADNNTRTSIANYFNPVQLADSTTNRKGLRDPNSTTSSEDREGEAKAKATSKEEGKEGGKSGEGDKESPAQQTQKPRYKEGALFQDPYAILAKLAEAEQERPQDTLGADVPLGESGEPGLDGGEAYRDPFDPLYWQVAPVPTPKTDRPGPPKTTTPVPPDGRLDALAPASQDQPEVPPNAKTVGEKPGVKTVAQGSATTVAKAPALSPEAEIKAEISKALELATDSNPKPRVEVTRVGEGVLISVTDEINFSMFAVGSAEPQAKVVRSMEKIAKILSSRPGKIVIRGHTDGRPFKSDSYDNWRLSTARAHMAYYMLVRGGVDERRIERVEGHADRTLKNQADPFAAENRRIEILLREQS